MSSKEIHDESSAYILRPDLHRSLAQSHIDPSKLSPFQRIILTTDGTLTEILEAYLFDTIKVVKLFEGIIPIEQDIIPLELRAGEEVIDRKILLQGKRTQRNWLYAESIIVPTRLQDDFRQGLLESQIPIGKLWLEHKVETFKEIIASTREPAGELSSYFEIRKEEQLLGRTYCVFCHRQPIMMITEKFPESYFF